MDGEAHKVWVVEDAFAVGWFRKRLRLCDHRGHRASLRQDVEGGCCEPAAAANKARG